MSALEGDRSGMQYSGKSRLFSYLRPKFKANCATRACEGAGLRKGKPPIILDAGVKGWAENMARQHLIFLSNLLHLISENEASIVIIEAAKALTPDGIFVIYRPFLCGTTCRPAL